MAARKKAAPAAPTTRTATVRLTPPKPFRVLYAEPGELNDYNAGPQHLEFDVEIPLSIDDLFAARAEAIYRWEAEFLSNEDITVRVRV